MSDDKKMQNLPDDKFENVAGGEVYYANSYAGWVAMGPRDEYGIGEYAGYPTKEEAQAYARKRGWSDKVVNR